MSEKTNDEIDIIEPVVQEVGEHKDLPNWAIWLFGIPVYIWGMLIAIEMIALAIYLFNASPALFFVLTFLLGITFFLFFAPPALAIGSYHLMVEWALEPRNIWEQWGKLALAFVGAIVGSFLASVIAKLIVTFLITLFA